MTDPLSVTASPRDYVKHRPRHLALPDGDTLIPRSELAAEIGCTERTLRKLTNLAVTKISNVAYVRRNAALAAYLEAHTRPPPKPRKPRGRR